MLLGHQGIILPQRDPLVSCPGMESVSAATSRHGAYDSPRERDAERLASMVMERAWRPTFSTYLRQVRAYRQLQPLWQAVYEAMPEIALPPDPLNDASLSFKLYRRVIEIRDGELALRSYRDEQMVVNAMHPASTPNGGTSTPNGGSSDLQAAVEAAALARAIDTRRASTRPCNNEAAQQPLIKPPDNLSDAITWLTAVSRAFARAPNSR